MWESEREVDRKYHPSISHAHDEEESNTCSSNSSNSSTAFQSSSSLPLTTMETLNDEQGSRIRKGRASRRRRQKILEISKAEQELKAAAAVATTDGQAEGSSSPTNDNTLFLPLDRGELRAPVVETRLKLGWNERDEMLLVRQLGFVPGNAIRICCRTKDLQNDERIGLGQQQPSAPLMTNSQDPVVVQLYPLAIRDEFMGGKTGGRKGKSRKRKRLLQGNEPTEASETEPNQEEQSGAAVLEPFPTIYWLTNPLLKVWVSKLEVNNFGTQLEARLQNDTAASARMKRAHAAYGRTRLSLLTQQDGEEIAKRKWTAALEQARGVAGIRNHMAVKCLHAHLAHYLSRDEGSQENVIGEWVMQAIREMLESDGKDASHDNDDDEDDDDEAT